MKRLHCRCGEIVYFYNHRCVNCGRELAFDPDTLTMLAEPTAGAGLPFCKNRAAAIRCNWVPKAGNTAGFCLSCALSRTIPALGKPRNQERWRKLESAKRYLIYDLLRLGLPVDDSRLSFEFKEDRRTNPDVSDLHVATGHWSGTITINAAEADEVFREEMRQKMNEPWRTLLGHMRHESGHYYFSQLVDDSNRDAARALFGDESTDYESSMAAYYRDGPRQDWNREFISAYASSHPAEDWAECWAHYLHIRAVLEVAAEAGFAGAGGDARWRERFISLVLDLNEIMRALGLPDAYPFVITESVARKIDFVHQAIKRRRARLARCT